MCSNISNQSKAFTKHFWLFKLHTHLIQLDMWFSIASYVCAIAHTQKNHHFVLLCIGIRTQKRSLSHNKHCLGLTVRWV